MDRVVSTLTSEQKGSFDDNGFLLLKAFYSPNEMAEMRREFHKLINRIEGRPLNISYDCKEPPVGYDADPFNPHNVHGIMDQTLASDFWFDQFTDHRIVAVMVDLLGANIDFHNGKVRNKPPGFHNQQSWHQDWPYERHTEPDLAAAITYLDVTAFEAGATEVIPGSHLVGEWPTREDGHTIAEADVPEERAVVIKAEAGDVAIIHVQVVHRAGHNYSPNSRHAIINEYKTMEARAQWNNRCAFAGLPLARNGQPVMPRVQRQHPPD